MGNWPGQTAYRYTKSGTGDVFISSMTALSLVGLILGVAVLVLVLSVLNGFERELRIRVLSVIPHAVISSSKPLENWQASAALIVQHPEVTAVAPIEEFGGLAVASGNVVATQIVGVLPDVERSVSKIPDFMLEGSFDDLNKAKYSVIVGKGIAAELGLQLGSKVSLILPEVQMTLAGPQPRTRRFEVVGVFSVGSDADKNQMFIHIDDALRLGRKTGLSSFRIAVVDLFEASRVLREVAQALPQQNWFGSSWLRRHGNLYDAIATQKTTLFLLLLMLVAVASFNLVSNLVMIVNQRKADIAILRTMGATRSDILLIFLYHGLFIGIIGISIGLALGCLLATFITPIYELIDSFLQLGLMDEYFIHYLPSQILLNDLFLVGGVSLLVCFLATLYPASEAARTLPAEALRYE